MNGVIICSLNYDNTSRSLWIFHTAVFEIIWRYIFSLIFTNEIVIFLSNNTFWINVSILCQKHVQNNIILYPILHCMFYMCVSKDMLIFYTIYKYLIFGIILSRNFCYYFILLFSKFFALLFLCTKNTQIVYSTSTTNLPDFTRFYKPIIKKC